MSELGEMKSMLDIGLVKLNFRVIAVKRNKFLHDAWYSLRNHTL